METVTKPDSAPRRPEHNHKLGGLVLIIAGILVLLNKIPQTSVWFPGWFFTWPMLMIGIGLFIGIKSKFTNIAWLVLMLIGGYFLLAEQHWITLNLRPFALPLGLILLGIFVILKKNHRISDRRFRRFGHRHIPPHCRPGVFDNSDKNTSEDTISINSTFGNIEKNVFSKDFKGGNISSYFGGAQINFIQADFQGTAVVDVSVMFGGVDIIIPSNWNLKNEIGVIFGGIEDRRVVAPNALESTKTLILRGSVTFGGIEIKSY